MRKSCKVVNSSPSKFFLNIVSIFSEIPTVWLQISLVGIWLGFILLVAEGLNRFTSVDPEVSRKVVHMGSGNVILLAWWLEIPVCSRRGSSRPFLVCRQSLWRARPYFCHSSA